MKKSLIRYTFVLISFLFLGCSEMPVDWRRTFDSKDSLPFGTLVLRQELSEIFPDSRISNISQNTYDHFFEIQYDYLSDHYMFIYDDVLLDEPTWEMILAHVNQGGSAFISLPVNNSVFEKNLGTSVKNLNSVPGQDQAVLSVKTPENEKKYTYDKGTGTSYFEGFKEETTEVLGYLEYNGEKHPNFLKVYYGHGYLLLHTEPIAFTNYYMLKNENAQYVTDVFSFLNTEDIMWDNHRMFRRYSGESNDGGLFNGLNFIMQQEGLRIAFLLLVILGVLYLFFNSKRRQRAVPIVLPYPNYTLDFAKTLSELYRYNRDHTAMVRYKINYFLEQLRLHYNITSKDTEKDFSELLSAKSGVDIGLCKKLVLTIDIFRSRPYLDKEDFFKIQSLIESFTYKSKNYGRTTTRK